jgi:hypothetical protein
MLKSNYFGPVYFGDIVSGVFTPVLAKHSKSLLDGAIRRRGDGQGRPGTDAHHDPTSSSSVNGLTIETLAHAYQLSGHRDQATV